jgi:hypothetical protein
MNGLNKENFWNIIEKQYPKAFDLFSKWVDAYKAEVKWSTLFQDGIKFHDLPFEMQDGILNRFNIEMFQGEVAYKSIWIGEPVRIQNMFKIIDERIEA